MLHASADGDEVVQIYTATNASGDPVRIAELITVRNGRVAATAPVVDEAAYRKFASGWG